MANLAYGLHVSPWWVLLILEACVVGAVWNFYSRTLIKTYVTLGLRHKLSQALLLFAVTLVLFGFYGISGLHHYGQISHFVSLLSLWAVIPIAMLNWPWRFWVENKIKINKQECL